MKITNDRERIIDINEGEYVNAVGIVGMDGKELYYFSGIAFLELGIILNLDGIYYPVQEIIGFLEKRPSTDSEIEDVLDRFKNNLTSKNPYQYWIMDRTHYDEMDLYIESSKESDILTIKYNVFTSKNELIEYNKSRNYWG